MIDRLISQSDFRMQKPLLSVGFLTCSALAAVSPKGLTPAGIGCLTITYFHTGIRTIIGVESFHGPVRDGKGWDQLALVIRHNLLLRCLFRQRNQSGEEVVGLRGICKRLMIDSHQLSQPAGHNNFESWYCTTLNIWLCLPPKRGWDPRKC